MVKKVVVLVLSGMFLVSTGPVRTGAHLICLGTSNIIQSTSEGEVLRFYSRLRLVDWYRAARLGIAREYACLDASCGSL